MNRSTVTTLLGILVAFVLYQYKPLKPYVTVIMLLLILGILLRYYPQIKSQFTNFGK